VRYYLFVVMIMVAGLACAQSGGQGSSGGGSSGNPKPPVVVPAPGGSGKDSAGGGSGGGKPVSGTSSGAETAKPGQSSTERSGTTTKPATPSATATKPKFSDWLSTSREGAALSGVKERLTILSAPAIAAGVPEEAFIARVREAVAKGASTEVAVAAIEADAKRWIWLSGLIREESWPPAALSTNFYLATAAAMRSGLDQESIKVVVTWAAGSKASAEKVGAALTSTTTILARLQSRKTDGAGGSQTYLDAGGIALCLAKSRLRVGQFPDVEELATRAAAAGMDTSRFRLALEATIGQGKKLADLEKALFD